MTLYFAYGANMDRSGMRSRCPRAVARGPGRLHDHRFAIMAEGYATVRAEPGAAVHGLVWDLGPGEVAALDAFEEIGAGLYRRDRVAVEQAGRTIETLVYRGCSTLPGVARPGYMELVIEAARIGGLPADYLRELERWLPMLREPLRHL